jgi:hypothetical protein
MYPTPESEARAEWSLPGWEVNATFDLKIRSVRLHATQLDGDASEDCELEITAAHAAETVVRFIQQFLSKTQRS